MTTYVLIPGACHGAWCFDDLADGLRSQGHRVLVLTLTGIAERAHLLHGGVNLETHIVDVVAELAAHDVSDAVLVGHSYGGMVITVSPTAYPKRSTHWCISTRSSPITVNRVGISSMTRRGSGISMSMTPATASPRCRSSTRAPLRIPSPRFSSDQADRRPGTSTN